MDWDHFWLDLTGKCPLKGERVAACINAWLLMFVSVILVLSILCLIRILVG